jgi:hypothetical protein
VHCWAARERGHGDADQVDPTIDAHGVIRITTPGPSGAHPGARAPLVVAEIPTTSPVPASEYLAKAQAELRAAHPVRDLHRVDNAEYLKYVACMRAVSEHS